MSQGCRFIWTALALAGPVLSAGEPAPAELWPAPTSPEALEARLKERRVRRPNEQDLKKIEAAAPAQAPAKPAFAPQSALLGTPVDPRRQRLL